jgi:hypothetical protein
VWSPWALWCAGIDAKHALYTVLVVVYCISTMYSVVPTPACGQRPLLSETAAGAGALSVTATVMALSG